MYQEPKEKRGSSNRLMTGMFLAILLVVGSGLAGMIVLWLLYTGKFSF